MTFDLSKIKLVIFDFDGVFTDNTVIVNEKGEEAVVCNRSDGIGIMRLKKADIDSMVLSMEKNKVVLKRCEKLGINCVNGCMDKISQLRNEIKKRGITLGEVAYVGNDINDIECLKAVGMPIVVADAQKDVLPLGKYKTKLCGGKGAVREICDMIYLAKKGK